jgi:hypothetical protein
VPLLLLLLRLLLLQLLLFLGPHQAPIQLLPQQHQAHLLCCCWRLL